MYVISKVNENTVKGIHFEGLVEKKAKLHDFQVSALFELFCDNWVQEHEDSGTAELSTEGYSSSIQ